MKCIELAPLCRHNGIVAHLSTVSWVVKWKWSGRLSARKSNWTDEFLFTCTQL